MTVEQVRRSRYRSCARDDGCAGARGAWQWDSVGVAASVGVGASVGVSAFGSMAFNMGVGTRVATCVLARPGRVNARLALAYRDGKAHWQCPMRHQGSYPLSVAPAPPSPWSAVQDAAAHMWPAPHATRPVPPRPARFGLPSHLVALFPQRVMAVLVLRGAWRGWGAACGSALVKEAPTQPRCVRCTQVPVALAMRSKPP